MDVHTYYVLYDTSCLFLIELWRSVGNSQEGQELYMASQIVSKAHCLGSRCPIQIRFIVLSLNDLSQEESQQEEAPDKQ